MSNGFLLLLSVSHFAHRRSQNYVWGALFLKKSWRPC